MHFSDFFAIENLLKNKWLLANYEWKHGYMKWKDKAHTEMELIEDPVLGEYWIYPDKPKRWWLKRLSPAIANFRFNIEFEGTKLINSINSFLSKVKFLRLIISLVFSLTMEISILIPFS